MLDKIQQFQYHYQPDYLLKIADKFQLLLHELRKMTSIIKIDYRHLNYKTAQLPIRDRYNVNFNSSLNR